MHSAVSCRAVPCRARILTLGPGQWMSGILSSESVDMSNHTHTTSTSCSFWWGRLFSIVPLPRPWGHGTVNL